MQMEMQMAGLKKGDFSPMDFLLERLLVPSHRGKAVSGVRVSQESSPGFLAVGESQALLSREIGLPAHLLVETGGAV